MQLKPVAGALSWSSIHGGVRAVRPSAVLLFVLAASLSGCHAHPKPSGLWDQPWRMGKLASIRLGPAFKLTEVTPLPKLTSSPQKWANKTVRTRGRIASVCNEAGCWIDIWPLSGTGHGVLVNAGGKLFSHALDSAGRVAEVEGKFFVNSYPPKRTRHWTHHGWRPRQEIKGPMKVYRTEATTVEIH